MFDGIMKVFVALNLGSFEIDETNNDENKFIDSKISSDTFTKFTVLHSATVVLSEVQVFSYILFHSD